MTPLDSTNLDSFLPIYHDVPENWEQAREFLVEQLKLISDIVNVRTIGYLIDQEILSGQQFIPGVSDMANDLPQQYRSVLRKVVIAGPLSIGANTIAHGIVVDANFTLIHLWASATNNSTLIAEPIPNGADTITMNATNFIITVAAAWPLCYVFCEYTQEI